MPIQLIREEDGRTGPKVLCDHCGKRPENAEIGVEMMFTHKACSLAFERVNDAHDWYTNELNTFPIRIAANLNMDLEIETISPGVVRYSLTEKLFHD